MLDFAAVRAVLPHATPMVLVDRVEWLVPGRALRAVKAISGSEPCYDHLPPGLPAARYAYPESLILESFGQAAALLWHSATGQLVDDGCLLMFAAARDCRFEGRAFPGDVLCHEVELEATVAQTGFATGATWLGQRRIATMGSFVAVVRPAASLARPRFGPAQPGASSSSSAASSAR